MKPTGPNLDPTSNHLLWPMPFQSFWDEKVAWVNSAEYVLGSNLEAAVIAAHNTAHLITDIVSDHQYAIMPIHAPLASLYPLDVHEEL